MSPKWEGQGPRAIKRLSLLALTLPPQNSNFINDPCSAHDLCSVNTLQFFSRLESFLKKKFFLIIYKDLKNTSVLSYQLNTWTVQCENIPIYIPMLFQCENIPISISNVIPMWEYSAKCWNSSDCYLISYSWSSRAFHISFCDEKQSFKFDKEMVQWQSNLIICFPILGVRLKF